MRAEPAAYLGPIWDHTFWAVENDLRGRERRFHPLRIRHGVRIACSEPSRWVQFVQFDQHKRLASDFASA
jgi:hypothetical protein